MQAASNSVKRARPRRSNEWQRRNGSPQFRVPPRAIVLVRLGLAVTSLTRDLHLRPSLIVSLAFIRVRRYWFQAGALSILSSSSSGPKASISSRSLRWGIKLTITGTISNISAGANSIPPTITVASGR